MKINLFLDTGFAGARHEEQIECPDEEWGKMSVREQDEFVEDYLQAMADQYIDSWYEVEGD